MTRLLFESLWQLAAAWIAAQFLLVVIWSATRTDFWRRAVWGGFALGPMLLILSKVVVTPREGVEAVCRDLARAVDEGDLAPIRAALSPDFQAADLDAIRFMERVESVLSRVRVEGARLSAFSVTFPARSEAVAEFTASAHVRSEETFLEWLLSRWRLTFRQSGDQWLVTGIETIRSPTLNLPGLRDLLR